MEAEGLTATILGHVGDGEAGSDIALVQWDRMLQRWREAILACYPRRVSNGYTEGVHTRIKLLKRSSYGLRNQEANVRKMLLAFVPLAWLTAIADSLS